MRIVFVFFYAGHFRHFSLTYQAAAAIGAIGAAGPLFEFLPRLIQRAIEADTAAAIEAFGKNEQVKKVFRTFFNGMAGLVLARVVDPVTAQQIIG